MMAILEEDRTFGEHAGTIVDTTAQALFEETRALRRKRRRRWGLAVISILVVMFLVIALIRHAQGMSTGSGSSVHAASDIGITTTSMPKDMVVWRDFKIEVIASANGRLVRTLASNIAVFRGTPSPSIAPDRTVYFDKGVETTPGVPITQIVSVPLGGGPTSIVAEGHDPAVSPDGRALAYLTDVDISGSSLGIVVRDLRSGLSTAWYVPSRQLDISGLVWSPDSTHLAFTVMRPAANRRSATVTTQAIDVSAPGVPLEQAASIPLPKGMSFAGYVNPRQAIAVLQHRDPLGRETWFQLSIVDVHSGQVIRRLPTIAGSLAVSNIYDGVEGLVQVDSSGQHLAVVERGSGFGSLSSFTFAGNRLGTWIRPIHLANGVGSVAWGPTR